MKNSMTSFLFYIILVQKSSMARNWINSVPQTAATTFAFSSVFILLCFQVSQVSLTPPPTQTVGGFFFKHHKYKLYESSDLEIYRKDDQLDLSLEVMYSQIRSCMAKVPSTNTTCFHKTVVDNFLRLTQTIAFMGFVNCFRNIFRAIGARRGVARWKYGANLRYNRNDFWLQNQLAFDGG